jgi:hypothetical protein
MKLPTMKRPWLFLLGAPALFLASCGEPIAEEAGSSNLKEGATADEARVAPPPAERGAPIDLLAACKMRAEAFQRECAAGRKDPACGQDPAGIVDSCLRDAKRAEEPRQAEDPRRAEDRRRAEREGRVAPPPAERGAPVDLLAACKMRAEAFQRECAAGRKDPACGQDPAGIVDSCLKDAKRTEEPEGRVAPPPAERGAPVDILSACKRRVEALQRECTAGRNDPACGQDLEGLVERCVAEHTKRTAPEPTRPSGEGAAGCAEGAERARIACVDAGKDPAECRAAEAERVRACSPAPADRR